ncbi:DUF4837 family protein [Membranicola marinus]|uniref:DUF4837 family protein n=1 Tax=Membranihabitans marinus TaxID=1227546 RepID=A0A953HU97_9BACT|nr:DUF4837 family protein [Membranihabitans marinus]MBY5956566.1 DUF4837 family protein [Membranihabitans marinus]
MCIPNAPYLFPLYFVIFVSSILVGCGDSSEYRGDIKPSSMGKIYQVNTLVSPEVFNSDVIDTFDYRYGRAYPILPQPEPYFELRYYEARDLDEQPLLRNLKCFLVLADMSIDDELTRMVRRDFRESIDFKDPGVKIGQDKWARDQLIIYIYAPDQASLIKEINRSYLTISNRIEQFYQGMIQSTVYVQGQNKMIQDTLKQKFQIDMKIPADYTTALVADSLIWLRQEVPEISRSIMVARFPYKSQDQFSKEGIIQMRNRMGEYISSTVSGTYMRVNATDLPMFTESTEINGQYAVKADGIWEIVGDFLGGSFVSYLLLDEEQQEVVFIDGFVYSPEKKKKLSMVYLDYILRQTKLSE